MKTQSDTTQVVVTGLGVISSIGIGIEEFWPNLVAGKSGISRIESFDTSSFDRHFGGEIKDFEPSEFLDQRWIKNLGRASQLAMSAAHLSLQDAGLSKRELAKANAGTCMGTTTGEAQVMEEIDAIWDNLGEKKVNIKLPFLYPCSIIPMSISHEFKLTGGMYLFSNACAAGNYSIGYAFDLIRAGRSEVMLAGGCDAFSRVNLAGFSRLFAVAPDICQPFDKNRKGMMVGEGAGVLVLEDLKHALKRKAKIYAEVLGYGLACDAHHMTNASIEGISRGIQKALDYSGIKPEEVDYINAHGTGTPGNDVIECAAINKVFKKRKLPVNSIKSMLGHTMGAASAIEAIACCLTIKEGIIPPTINYETPDPQCDIDCVPNKARKQSINIALNNSQAFGGNNACLVLKKLIGKDQK